MLKLRSYVPEDSVYITQWLTSELSFYQWSADRLIGKYPLEPSVLDGYYELMKQQQEFRAMAAVEEGGELAGQFIMRVPEGSSAKERVIRLGFIILNPSLRGKGHGKEMVSLGAAHAFQSLGAAKVTLGVFANNPSAQHCYEAAGFAAVGEDKYQVMEEEWSCIEMELTKQVWEQRSLNKID